MLKIKDLSFKYSSNKTVLENLSFEVKQGQHLAIMGTSGSGKSTLLKLLYGLLDTSEGTISHNRTFLYGPSRHLIPGHNFMKYVSQDFDLMPYTTVAENISQYLSVFLPNELQARTEELLELIDMTSFADIKTTFLSGGQKQRVALAKAIAQEPKILLLDEPFSHIDSFKKNELRRRLFSYLKKHQISCIVATHDKEDVLPFSDCLIVLKDKTIHTLGNPKKIYNLPKDKYTASLFGDVSELNNHLFYPHQLQICSQSNYKARIVTSRFMGSHYLLEVKMGEHTLYIMNEQEIEKNSLVFIQPKTL